METEPQPSQVVVGPTATTASNDGSASKRSPGGSKNVGDMGVNFTIPQIIAVLSFLGTAAVTVGYAAYSYYTTVHTVETLQKDNLGIQHNIDSLFRITNDLKEGLKSKSDSLKKGKQDE